MNKELPKEYLDEYQPEVFSDSFIEVRNRSKLHLINKALVWTHFFLKDLKKYSNKEYKAKQALLTILDRFLQSEDENILNQAEYIKNKTAQNILKELLNIKDKSWKIYNAHFLVNHFRNWYLLSDITIDDLKQVIYKHMPSLHYKTVQIRDYLDYRILYTQQDKENLEYCLDALEKGYNVIHISNHPTHFTFGISIGQLEQLNSKRAQPLENLNDMLYIILWWALMTNKAGKLALGDANVLKTHPQTDNGKIPPIQEEQLHGTQKFLHTILKINDEDQQEWKIFFIAPPATKDTIDREGKKENKIFFWDDSIESVEKTLNLVKRMIKRNPKTILLLAGVNESDIKNPSFVSPYNNELKKHCYVPMKTKTYTPDNMEDFLTLIENKEVMAHIAEMVLDIHGNSIAQALPSDELNNMKNKIQIARKVRPSK